MRWNILYIFISQLKLWVTCLYPLPILPHWIIVFSFFFFKKKYKYVIYELGKWAFHHMSCRHFFSYFVFWFCLGSFKTYFYVEDVLIFAAMTSVLFHDYKSLCFLPQDHKNIYTHFLLELFTALFFKCFIKFFSFESLMQLKFISGRECRFIYFVPNIWLVS